MNHTLFAVIYLPKQTCTDKDSDDHHCLAASTLDESSTVKEQLSSVSMSLERNESYIEEASTQTWPGGSSFGQTSRHRRPSDGAEYRSHRPQFHVGDLAVAEMLDDKVRLTEESDVCR